MSETDVKVLNEILSQKQAEVAQEMDEGEFFEFFSANEILRNYSSSPTDIQNGIVGGGNGGTDGGIDSFYLLVNGSFVSDKEAAENLKSLKQNVVIDLILVQSSREQTFSMDRVLRIGETSENVLSLGKSPPDFSEQYNESLLDAIERFRTAHRVLAAKFPTLNVSYFYVTKGETGKIADDVKRKATAVEERTKSLLATVTKAAFTFVGARELVELAIKPPKTTSPLPYVDVMDSPKGGYAAFVRLGDFYRFITEGDVMIDYLFDSNVRDYQGDVEVNKAIRETLAVPQASEDFWWLNNGITIVAARVGPGEHHELMIEEPYIVNGLQTSQEIFDYFNENKQSLADDDRQALIRIIASKNSETQDRIIRATNSQTGMGPASLWATDPIHRDLEKLFPSVGLYYDRRKSYWRNRDKPISKIVSIQDLAQSVIAMVLQEPHISRSSPSRYFKSRKLYERVFAKYFPIDLYTVCATTRKRAEAFLRSVEPDARHRNNLLYYLLLVAICLATKSQNPRPTTIAKRLTANPIDDAIFTDALVIVGSLYHELGGDDKVAKGPELVKQVKDAISKRFPKKGKKHEA